jgi:glycosyltransferase involved in cell wall biosynthesis
VTGDKGGRPRVAMVGYTFYESDARLKMYVDYLVDAGYDVDVVVVRDPNCEPPANSEHVTFFLPAKRRFERQGALQYILDYSAFTLACAWLMLKHHISGRRYAVVHINNMPNFVLFAALPIRLLGVRAILDLHDTMPEIFQVRGGVSPTHPMIRALRFEEWICLKLADFVLTSEHTKRDRLLENGLNRAKSSVILNLADPDIFPELPIPESTSTSPDRPFRMVFHGTLTWRLGVDTAIRAVNIARKEVPNLRFEITGDGEQRDELVALVRELGLETHVQFSSGFVPVEALADRLAGADLGVLASRENAATDLMLPVKLLEYARMGIPCLVVPTKSIKRYFQEPAVRFVPTDDPEAIAAAIVDLYRSPIARLDMARAARTFYDTYNFAAQGRTYIDIVNSLAAHRRPQAGAE